MDRRTMGHKKQFPHQKIRQKKCKLTTNFLFSKGTKQKITNNVSKKIKKIIS
jgi:hypothetical protein